MMRLLAQVIWASTIAFLGWHLLKKAVVLSLIAFLFTFAPGFGAFVKQLLVDARAGRLAEMAHEVNIIEHNQTYALAVAIANTQTRTRAMDDKRALAVCRGVVPLIVNSEEMNGDAKYELIRDLPCPD